MSPSGPTPATESPAREAHRLIGRRAAHNRRSPASRTLGSAVVPLISFFVDVAAVRRSEFQPSRGLAARVRRMGSPRDDSLQAKARRHLKQHDRATMRRTMRKRSRSRTLVSSNLLRSTIGRGRTSRRLARATVRSQSLLHLQTATWPRCVRGIIFASIPRRYGATTRRLTGRAGVTHRSF